MTAPDPQARIVEIRSAVEAVVRGKGEVIELALVAALAGGHLLIEDVPGVGKTTLAWTLARVLGGTFKRVQFTSDLLPSDLLGVNILDPATGTFRFRPGPVFANVLLADEINRTTPRTQSALLEAMNERAVTVDGITWPLPRPFLVVATQNPFDFHGTFPLPDSQLDRFLARVSMGYPDREAERQVLRSGGLRHAHPTEILTPDETLNLMDRVEEVQVHPEVEDYLLDLVARTRQDDRLVRGVSPRGSEALLRACRALALVRHRDHVLPDDVRELVVPVWAHRVVPRADTWAGRTEAAAQALREMLWDVPAPT